MPSIIADAASTSSKAGDAAILTGLASAAAGLIGTAAGWLWSRWVSRRTDAIRELGEIIERLKGDIKEVQTQYRDVVKDNAECLAHREKTVEMLDEANAKIAEQADELLLLRVETAKRIDRGEHAIKSIANVALINTAAVAALAAKVEEPPPSPPEEPPPP